MSIYKETELGKIKLPPKFFASIIENTLKLPSFDGKVWPATKKGKMVEEPSMSNMFMAGDFAGNLEVSMGEAGEITLEFPVIMKFGVSISKVTDKLCAHIYEELKDTVNPRHLTIVINIIGMKSKHIAKRDIRIEKEFEA